MNREEAVKILEKLKSDYLHGYVAYNKLIPDALDVVIEALATRWISVTEKLPEDSTAVLVWCPAQKNVYCAYHEEKQWWVFGANYLQVDSEVTAWMPLPELYKPESEDK